MTITLHGHGKSPTEKSGVEGLRAQTLETDPLHLYLLTSNRTLGKKSPHRASTSSFVNWRCKSTLLTCGENRTWPAASTMSLLDSIHSTHRTRGQVREALAMWENLVRLHFSTGINATCSNPTIMNQHEESKRLKMARDKARSWQNKRNLRFQVSNSSPAYNSWDNGHRKYKLGS